MKLFEYDSKPMQILAFLGDLMILNFLYLLCCIPVFTIGAAQAGMFTGLRILTDPEDDSSAAAAFFRGFKNGFGKVTAAWGIATVVLLVVAFAGIGSVAYGAPVWMAIVAVCVVALFQSLIAPFHSRFDCTVLQLLRNTWFLVIAHPLRSLLIAALIWLPIALFLLNTYLFMSLTPLWITIYFSGACLFGFTFLKKPFKTLIDHFNETHNPPSEEEIDTEE